MPLALRISKTVTTGKIGWTTRAGKETDDTAQRREILDELHLNAPCKRKGGGGIEAYWAKEPFLSRMPQSI